MQREKGISYCGLACALCTNQECSGCQRKGCEHYVSCKIYTCCENKKIKGCAYCNEYPCEMDMLKKPRVAVFNDVIRQYGEEVLLDCLEKNEKHGIRYHYENSITGDYDKSESMAEIKALLLRELEKRLADC